ncbi:hypothetical protein KAR28_01060 [Candidatus Parcubacteria bacterium]|nr:hypothetical protein [Candidatus Parcubacteria bacterium]
MKYFQKNFYIKYFLIAIIIFVTFSINSIGRVEAVTNPYNKISPDQFLHSEWNSLLSDFLAKDGATTVNGVNNAMQGDFDMGTNSIVNVATPGALSAGSNIANKAYVNSIIAFSGAAQDPQGNIKKIVCGQTLLGATGWTSYLVNILQVDIHTTDDGTPFGAPLFSSTPVYITSMGGRWNHLTTGATNILNQTNVGFRVRIDYTQGFTDPDTANGRGWHIQWCAIGD